MSEDRIVGELKPIPRGFHERLCPMCMSDAGVVTEEDPIEIDGKTVTVGKTHDLCGKSWVEYFTLSGIAEEIK